MTYFPDLSPYSYFRHERGTWNVGWLDADHPFETAAPSQELLDALWLFLKTPVVQTRGFHTCELCLRAPLPEDKRSRSTIARRGDEQLQIGTAEIRVFGERGVSYAAPTLIYHYVSEHHYKPPDEFVRALLAGPHPPSEEYRARLRRAGVE